MLRLPASIGSVLLEHLRVTVSPRAKLRRAAWLAQVGRAAEAFALLAPLAERGDAEAMLQVGHAYLHGAGVPLSRGEAVRWLEGAAIKGLVEAQAALVALYLTGVPTVSGNELELFDKSAAPLPPDFERAMHWAVRAVEGGSAEAKALLAEIYASGPDALRDLTRSDALYKESAEAGSVRGALGHGMAMLRRSNERDKEALGEAARWIDKAAHAGVPLASYLLGVMLDQGKGLERDLEKAARMYCLAAESGVRQGQVRWGMVLLQGRGVAKNSLAGETWLRRAALGGDAEAAALLGDIYAREDGEESANVVEAALWYTRAAEGGHAAAARALAILHLRGAGMVRNLDMATHWFRWAAERGDQRAQAELANLALGGMGAPDDRVRTRAWFEANAEAGDPTAAFNFGVCLAEGVGGTRDEPRAIFWLRRAAEQGVANAQHLYGRMLAEGCGVTIADPVEGRIWIEAAATTGLASAQAALAEMLLNGRGGPRDPARALSLFKAAAETGHIGSAFAIGAMLGGGHDVPTDYVVAQDWFRRAAEHDHPYAQLMLGRYLARGLGGEYNPKAARHWLEQARAHGVTTEAEDDLATLL